MNFNSILFVGCGNMGGAMLDGWLAGGIASSRFTIVDPYLERAPDGVELLRELPDRQFDAVLLGIKPHMLNDLAPDIRKVTGEDTLILSVLAGVEVETLRRHFPAAAACIRVMPNLSAKLGKSPIALVGDGLEEAGRNEVTQFFEHLGTPEWLQGEEHFDLVTALAGSGPGFVYRFIDALAKGAAELGLPRDQAVRLAVATVGGASPLAAATEHSPSHLARRVASPGGVTQVGLDVMDKDDRVLRLMHDTLRGARDRSAEMAREAREKD